MYATAKIGILSQTSYQGINHLKKSCSRDLILPKTFTDFLRFVHENVPLDIPQVKVRSLKLRRAQQLLKWLPEVQMLANRIFHLFSKTKQISNNKNDKKLIKSESEPFKKKSKKNHMVQNIQKKNVS